MSKTLTALGPREVQFLAAMARTGRPFFAFDAARSFWGDPQYTRNVLARLESKGWLERLERGRYMLVPLEAGESRQWSEDPIAVGTFLTPDAAAAYWTAVRHWGWTTQFPGQYLFITARRRFRLRQEVLGLPYRFVVVPPERYFGVQTESTGRLDLRVTDRERTLVDILHRTDLSGGIAEVANALADAWSEIDRDRLMDYVYRFGSGTVPKRLGFLLEHLGLESPGTPVIEACIAAVGTGFTLLDRGGPNTGRHVRRWGLRVNSSGFET
jgi:predicted transcriptional regulator of viral defense system